MTIRSYMYIDWGEGIIQFVETQERLFEFFDGCEDMTYCSLDGYFLHPNYEDPLVLLYSCYDGNFIDQSTDPKLPAIGQGMPMMRYMLIDWYDQLIQFMPDKERLDDAFDGCEDLGIEALEGYYLHPTEDDPLVLLFSCTDGEFQNHENELENNLGS